MQASRSCTVQQGLDQAGEHSKARRELLRTTRDDRALLMPGYDKYAGREASAVRACSKATFGQKLVGEGRNREKISSLPYRFWICSIYDAATSFPMALVLISRQRPDYAGLFASGFFVAVSNLASL